MQQSLLTEEQKMFREAVKEFLARDVMPYHEQWEKDGIVSREVWQKAGENGFLCMDAPEAIVRGASCQAANPWAIAGIGVLIAVSVGAVSFATNHWSAW